MLTRHREAVLAPPMSDLGLGVFPEHLLDDLHGVGADSKAVDEVNGPGNETILGQLRRFLFRSSTETTLDWRSQARDLS